MEKTTDNMEKVIRTLKGAVVSDVMDKTVVVKVDRYVKHPKYLKRRKVSKRYKAHDADNKCVIGDIVLIEECRPISKDKTFIVKEVLVSAK